MTLPALRFAGFCAVLAACGGSTVFIEGSPDAATGSDSGSTEGGTTSTTARDAAGDGRPSRDAANVDAGACVDADLPNLSAPDAALGDSGGSIGKCTACIKANCTPELQACQDDCDCREAAVALLDCLRSTQSVTTCGGTLVTAGATAQALGLCTLNAGCSAACGN